MSKVIYEDEILRILAPVKKEESPNIDAYVEHFMKVKQDLIDRDKDQKCRVVSARELTQIKKQLKSLEMTLRNINRTISKLEVGEPRKKWYSFLLFWK